jgi:hypothetical protein
MSCNLFSSFDTPKFDQAFASMGQGFGQKLSGLRVSFCGNDGSLLCLFGLFNQESGLLGFLLRNLRFVKENRA